MSNLSPGTKLDANTLAALAELLRELPPSTPREPGTVTVYERSGVTRRLTEQQREVERIAPPLFVLDETP